MKVRLNNIAILRVNEVNLSPHQVSINPHLSMFSEDIGMNPSANTCPCCGGSLLRHVRHGELYWFCQSCRQEVPLLTVIRVRHPRGETQNTAVLPPPMFKE